MVQLYRIVQLYRMVLMYHGTIVPVYVMFLVISGKLSTAYFWVDLCFFR